MDNKPEDNTPNPNSFGAGGYSTDPTPVPQAPPQTPSQPVAPTGLPLQKPKRSKKPLVFALLILVLLAAGAGAYYFLVMNKPANSNQPNNAAAQNQKPDVSAEKLMSEIKPLMKAKVATVETDSLGRGMAADGVTTLYGVSSYQPDNAKFLTSPAKQYGTATSAATSERETINKDFDAVVSFLEKRGFKTDNEATDPEFPRSVLYVSSDVLCTVSTYYDVEKNDFAGVACADVASYEEMANTSKPFYDAYIAANPHFAPKGNGPSMVYISDPEIKNGLANYKNALVLLANGIGLFYQESGKNWKYFANLDATLTCTKFNTPTLKNAFNGAPCFEADGKESTVKA